MLVALMASGTVGAFVARALRVPLWPMTGAIVGAAVLHLVLGGASQVPAWWSLLAQVLVGTAVGSRVNPGLVREFRAVLVPGTVAVLSIVLAGIGLGLAIAVTGLVDPIVAIFGLVPGGVGEMVAAVTALGGDSSVVAGMHLVRLLVVLSLLPILVRWVQRRRERPPGSPRPQPGGNP